ncbi:hypothetical protein [Atopococcus tabaci]|uniref:hypothetical protein n=1 Tax=Atopococcus tabaci TaxID=269774 RepID=UPI0003F84EEB|nr:hypothetical protein [Atopococcus tabaci]
MTKQIDKALKQLEEINKGKAYAHTLLFSISEYWEGVEEEARKDKGNSRTYHEIQRISGHMHILLSMLSDNLDNISDSKDTVEKLLRELGTHEEE